jgi:ribose transport system ATP-binding protein
MSGIEPSGTPLMEVRGITRVFGAFAALDDVSLAVHPREVVGFIGENGAGKSTLLNIMSGVDEQTEGEVWLRGERVAFKSYKDATAAGVFRIFQELALVPTLPVYQNLFLAHEDRFARFGVISRRAMIRRTRKLLADFDHAWVDPLRDVMTYDFSTRQVLEIIKAFALAELLEHEEPVILLDEPTAGLTKDEIDFFGSVIGQIRKRAGVVFVSHRLSELLEYSDRIYVIKDGVVVAQPAPKETSEAELHHLMVGRQRDEAFYKENRQREPEQQVALRLSGLGQDGEFSDVDLELHAGEIVGLAGVVGSGKSSLARAVFGAEGAVHGEVVVDGEVVRRPTIRSMMDAGVGYVSADRGTDGIILTLPISWNVSLAALNSGDKAKTVLPLKWERTESERFRKSLRIKAPNVDALASSLSGGTQQKVILARWLALGVKVLILDNPTKGIDAGAKEDVYEILRELTAQGTAILLISDELVELIGLANRIFIMKDGRVTREIETPPDAKPQEAALVAHMV